MSDTGKVHAFITLPMRERDQVAIDIAEIAAMREHTVVSYSYQRWTEVTLVNGKAFDCHISLADLEKRMLEAAASAINTGGDA